MTNKLYDYHAKLLREFKYDDNSSPYEAAKHDDEYDEVVEVLAHRFKSTKKRLSDLQLHIIWGKNHNPQWENWSTSLSASEKVHDYLKQNKLRKYIPKKYTWPKDHPEYDPPTKRVAQTKQP